jgi:hypothetical protein
MESNTTCRNCSIDFNGKFCPECRQPATTNRITWSELAHQLMHAFFHVDRGFWYTVSQMFLRPGNTIREYLYGKRAFHFNPFLFLILLGGTISLLFPAFHISVIAEKATTEAIENFNPVFAHKHFTIIGAVILFLLTLTDFIFYRKSNYTIPELLVSNAFQIGELLFFLLLMLPFLYLQNYVNASYHTNFEIRYFILTVFYSYLFAVRCQLYNARSNYTVIIRVIIQLVLVYAVVQYRIAKLMLETLQ